MSSPAPNSIFGSSKSESKSESKSNLSKIKRSHFVKENIRNHLKRCKVLPTVSAPDTVNNLKCWLEYKGYYKPLYNKCNTLDELLSRICYEYLYIRDVDRRQRHCFGSNRDLALLKKIEQDYPYPLQQRVYHGLHYLYRHGSKTLVLANIYPGCQQLILYDAGTVIYGQCMIKYKVKPDRVVFDGTNIRYTTCERSSVYDFHECESVAPYFTALKHRGPFVSRDAMPPSHNYTVARYNLGMFGFVPLKNNKPSNVNGERSY